MKLKLSQVIMAYDALRRLANQPYAPLTAYRIQKNIRSLEPDALAYEKARTELIKTKYGVKSLDSQTKAERFDVPPEKMQKFANELKPLQEEEVTLDILTIPLESLKEITPIELMALEWMFEAPNGSDPTLADISPKRKRPRK